MFLNNDATVAEESVARPRPLPARERKSRRVRTCTSANQSGSGAGVQSLSRVSRMQEERVTARTSSAVAYASAGTCAAESAARTTSRKIIVTVACAQRGMQVRISPALSTEKRLQVYFARGNKKRSAVSTLAAQAASL